MITFERRASPNKLWGLMAPLLAVFLAMLSGGLLFSIFGIHPLEALKTIFYDPIFSTQYSAYTRPQLLVKAGPLILIAIGLSLGFRAGIWNIGAEGQYIMGAIFGASVALAFFPRESALVFPLMILAGAFGGAIWALIPAILRVWFRTNEILVSLLLVYVAENILSAVSFGALRNPEGHGFPGSRNLQQYPSAYNAELIANSGLHWGVITAFIAVIMAYVIMARHIYGFQIRLMGENMEAAGFGGVKTKRIILITFVLSGICAGLAGLFEVAGPAGQISVDFNLGYGFTAIIVAFLGRLHPIGVLFAGLLLALSYIGGELAQLVHGLPAASIQVFQGMLLFYLLALDLFTHFKLRFKQAKPREDKVK